VTSGTTSVVKFEDFVNVKGTAVSPLLHNLSKYFAQVFVHIFGTGGELKAQALYFKFGMVHDLAIRELTNLANLRPRVV